MRLLLTETGHGGFRGVNLDNVTEVYYNPTAPIDIDLENSPTEPALFFHFSPEPYAIPARFNGATAKAMWRDLVNEYGYLKCPEAEQEADE